MNYQPRGSGPLWPWPFRKDVWTERSRQGEGEDNFSSSFTHNENKAKREALSRFVSHPSNTKWKKGTLVSFFFTRWTEKRARRIGLLLPLLMVFFQVFWNLITSSGSRKRLVVLFKQWFISAGEIASATVSNKQAIIEKEQIRFGGVGNNLHACMSSVHFPQFGASCFLFTFWLCS